MVTVVPIVVGTLGMVPKGLKRGVEEMKIGGRTKTIQTTGECYRGITVEVLDCRIVVSKYILQSCNYVHFSDIYLWERYDSPYPPSYGLNSTARVFLEGLIWH